MGKTSFIENERTDAGIIARNSLPTVEDWTSYYRHQQTSELFVRIE